MSGTRVPRSTVALIPYPSSERSRFVGGADPDAAVRVPLPGSDDDLGSAG